MCCCLGNPSTVLNQQLTLSCWLCTGPELPSCASTGMFCCSGWSLRSDKVCRKPTGDSYRSICKELLNGAISILSHNHVVIATTAEAGWVQRPTEAAIWVSSKLQKRAERGNKKAAPLLPLLRQGCTHFRCLLKYRKYCKMICKFCQEGQ